MKNRNLFQAFFIIIACSFLTTSLQGQQEILLSKYTFNSLFFNPSYAGSHGYGIGTVNLHYRNQWMGFEGAPTTLMAGGEVNLFKDRVGFGLTLINESIGVESRNDIATNYAYRIKLNNGYLCGGLRLGLSLFQNDFSRANAETAEINYLNYSVISGGAGLYYHTDGLYLGLAVPTMFVASKSNDIGDRVPHFYFHTGLMIGDEYSKVKFEPSLLLNYQKSVKTQFTIGINTWFNDGFAVGLHWRSQDAIAISTEIHFMQDFKFGLAYDLTTSELRNQSYGSMEALFGYRFNANKNNPRIKNLRYGGRF
jgi:type IX secretion system PorP/SprF family membrane protein